jgi:hypothetical protein
MNPFSAWSVRFSLVVVAGFALGRCLIGDGLPYTGGGNLAATAFPQSTFHAQGDDWGSGRFLCPNFSPVASYRGSGRITLRSQPDDAMLSPVASYRGSGRISPGPLPRASQPFDVATAYRGSGRVHPMTS